MKQRELADGIVKFEDGDDEGHKNAGRHQPMDDLLTAQQQ